MNHNKVESKQDKSKKKIANFHNPILWDKKQATPIYISIKFLDADSYFKCAFDINISRIKNMAYHLCIKPCPYDE